MKTRSTWFVLAFFAVVTFSIPVFRAGFYNDDAAHSVLESRRVMQAKSRGTFALEAFDYMLSQQGRPAVTWSFAILPLQTEIGDNLSVYRLVHYSGWCIALLSAIILFRQLSGAATGISAMAVVLSLAQFHNWHDGILSYFLFVPILISAGAWCTIFWHRGLTQDRPILTWVHAPLVYLFGLLSCNEFMLVYFPVICAISFGERRSIRLRFLRMLPIAIITVLYVSFSVWLKTRSSITYPGVALGPVSAMPTSYLMQLSATIPFSSAYFNPGGFMTTWVRDISIGEVCTALLGATSVGVLLRLGLEGDQASHREGPRRLALCGAALLLVSPVFTAISIKYQTELRWGWGYLQISLQVLGLAFLSFAALFWLRRALARLRNVFNFMAACISCAVGAVFFGHNLYNQHIVSRLNEYNVTPRNLSKTLLEHYSFPQAPSEQLQLVIDAPWLNAWEVSEFFFRHTGRRFQIATWSNFAKARHDKPPHTDKPEVLYYMACPPNLSSEDGDVIVFGQLFPREGAIEGLPVWDLRDTMIATRSLRGTRYRVNSASGSASLMANTFSASGFGATPASLYFYGPPIALGGSSISAEVLHQ